MPSSTTLGNPGSSDSGQTIVVEEPAYGYWVAGSGYPALNGIFAAEQREVAADGSRTLLYRHTDTGAELRWVPQGWLLALADGTDCFLQLSTNHLMVLGTPNSWQAIDSDDADPLAEPPDEVVALLDQGVVDDLIRAKRAHDERVRRARAAFALPFLGSSGSGSLPLGHAGDARWWRVVHAPAVVVRTEPSTSAAKLGLKLHGELVLGLEERGRWVRVHAPDASHTHGWMLFDGRELGLGALLQRCGTLLTCVDDDGEADWEELAQHGEPTAEPSREASPAGTGVEAGVEAEVEAAVEAQPAAREQLKSPPPQQKERRMVDEEATVVEMREQGDASPTATMETAARVVPKLPTAVTSVGARLRARLQTQETATAPAVTAPAAAAPPSDTPGSTIPATAVSQPAAVTAAERARLKSLGDAAFRSGQPAVAVDRYTEALHGLAADGARPPTLRSSGDCDGHGGGAERPAVLPLEAVLLCNRSAARRRLRQLSGAIEDARRALDLAPTYKKAALRVGVALFEREEYLAARAAFEHLLRLDGGWMALPWLQRCHARLEAAAAAKRGGSADGVGGVHSGGGGVAAQPNPYTLLDVACDCTAEQLRAAYKRRSLQVHPDRLGARKAATGDTAGDATGDATDRSAFQQLQAAYDLLKEPKARAIFDFGSETTDWELDARARYFPPTEFRPFARPSRTPRSAEWDPVS